MVKKDTETLCKGHTFCLVGKSNSSGESERARVRSNQEPDKCSQKGGKGGGVCAREMLLIEAWGKIIKLCCGAAPCRERELERTGYADSSAPYHDGARVEFGSVETSV